MFLKNHIWMSCCFVKFWT